MRNELNQIELIEAYLLGTLNPTEVASFENRLQNEPELARDVELQRQLTKRFNRSMMVAALNQAHGQWLGNHGGGGGTGGSSFLGSIGTWVTIGALAVVSLSTWWFLRTENSDFEHPVSEASLVYLDSLDDTAAHFHHVTDTSTFEQRAFAETKTELLEEEVVEAISQEEANIQNGSKLSRKKGQFQIHGNSTNAMSASMDDSIEFDLPDSENIDLETSVIVTAPTSIELKKVALSRLDTELDSTQKPSKALFSPDFDTFLIDPSQKQTLNFQGGRAIITIPARVLIDQKGYPVKEEVTILFRDFKTPGDMVTEEIPMHWPKGKDTMAFHSAGMYEIRAYTADGQEVFMSSASKGQPSVSVKYEINNSIDSLGFYYLNERTNRWEYQDEVAEKAIETPTDVDKENLSDSVKRNSRFITFNGKPIKRIEGTTKRKGFWARLFEFIGKGTINGKPNQRFKDVFTTPKWLVEKGNNKEPVKNPIVVQEHSIRQFGYHNYDQLRKMKSKITLFVNPIDSNGNKIENMTRYVVVEHRTNAAFHFYKDKILMHPKKKYDLILLCDSGTTYYCSYNSLMQATNKKSGRHDIVFTDITQVIRKPSDFDVLFHISRKKSKSATRLN